MRLEPVGSRPAPLRDRGVYLITGGLGGVGLALAGHLARSVKARLVLVSRSGVGSDAAGDRLRAVGELEAAGAEVLVCRADVSDRDQMRQALAEVARRFGRVHGVVHAAGLPGGGLMQLKSHAAAAAVLAPKVAGTLVLHELLGGEPLDFLVLCSSLTGVLGAVGQADYAAANAFLDAYAQQQHRAGHAVRTVSIAWDTWKEAGMAVTTRLPVTLAPGREELLRLGLTHAEGVEAFRRALQAGVPRLLVSTRDLRERLQASARAQASGPAGAPRPAGPARHPRPALQNEYTAPRGEVERALAEAWQGVLGIERVGVTDNFFELGGESLTALRMVALLKETRGLSVSLVRLYESPTIELLARQMGSTGPDASSVGTSGRRGEARADRIAQRRQGRTPGRVAEGGRE